MGQHGGGGVREGNGQRFFCLFVLLFIHFRRTKGLYTLIHDDLETMLFQKIVGGGQNWEGGLLLLGIKKKVYYNTK